MSGIRQLVLIVSMLLATMSQQYAGTMKSEIACGAAADSAANKNTITATQAGGYAALVVGVLTALGNRIPVVGNLLNRLGGAETIGRVVDNGQRLVEKRGADPNALTDLFRLAVEKGVASNPEVMALLGRLGLHLGDHALPEPAPGEPPSREECVAQLVRRIELDAARRVSGVIDTPPPTIPFTPKVA